MAKKEKTDVRTVRMSEKTIRWFERRAKSEKRKLSEYMRMCLEEFMEANKS